MSRCMIDMGEFYEPFYYPIQRIVTYGKPHWPSYRVWIVDPISAKHPWGISLTDPIVSDTPGGDV